MRTASKLSIGAALIGSVFLSFAGAAQASDYWDRDRDHRYWDHGWHHGRDRIVEHRIIERPVYMHEPRPVVVERPVFMAPQPMYQPMYQQPGPSGLNLNFNIPLN